MSVYAKSNYLIFLFIGELFKDFKYGTQEQNIEESLKTALSTWKTKPLTHISSSKCIEDSNSTPTAHADFIYDEILTFNMEFDIEIEAKKKDLALLRYRKEFLK